MMGDVVVAQTYGNLEKKDNLSNNIDDTVSNISLNENINSSDENNRATNGTFIMLIGVPTGTIIY